MIGGSGNDTYGVDDAGDVVVEDANAGTDQVNSWLASYTLGANVEKLLLQGSAVVLAGAGNALDNTITGNGYSNELRGEGGSDSISGGAGLDSLYGGAGNDTMAGDGGDDNYAIEDAGDVIVEAAGQGYDYVDIWTSYTLASGVYVEHISVDTPFMGSILTFTDNEDGHFITTNSGIGVTIDGQGGADDIRGGFYTDTLIGGAGADTITGDDGADYVYGDTTAYWASGGGADTIAGGAGDDTIQSGSGNDLVLGDAGADQLGGSSGADTLDGSSGSDWSWGGDGADLFLFSTAPGTGNVDHLQDFSGAGGDGDKIGLDHTIFAGLPPGALAASAFVSGTAATLAVAQILYDGATGNLYFDGDGTGAAGPIRFAIVSGHPALANTDVLVT